MFSFFKTEIREKEMGTEEENYMSPRVDQQQEAFFLSKSYLALTLIGVVSFIGMGLLLRTSNSSLDSMTTRSTDLAINSDKNCDNPVRNIWHSYAESDDRQYINSPCTPTKSCNTYPYTACLIDSSYMCNLDAYCKRRSGGSFTNFCYWGDGTTGPTCQSKINPSSALKFYGPNRDFFCKNPKWGVTHLYSESDDADLLNKECFDPMPYGKCDPADDACKKNYGFSCNVDSYCARRTTGSFSNFCYKDPNGNGKAYCKKFSEVKNGLNVDTKCIQPEKLSVQTYSNDDDSKYIGSKCDSPALNCNPYDRDCKITYRTAGMCNMDGYCTRRTFASYSNFCYRNPKDNTNTCQRMTIDQNELNLDTSCKDPKYWVGHVYESSDDAGYVGKACTPTQGINSMDYNRKKKTSYMCNADSYCSRRTLGKHIDLFIFRLK